MDSRQFKNTEQRQWRTLLVYNLYRILSVFLFLGIFIFNPILISYKLPFFCILFIYFLFTCVFLYFGLRHTISFDKQVFISGTIDVLLLSSILVLIGNLQLGQGIILNVTVAALSILAPGRLAIYFAALASCLLLCGSILQFIMNNEKELATLYYSGIYGAGFFATAITAWYLSNWVRMSENLAEHRKDELVGMQRINEYIVERLHSGIIYVDVNKHIKFINTAAREFFGLNKNGSVVSLEQVSLLLCQKFDNFLIKAKQHEPIAQAIFEEPFLRVHFFSTAVENNPAVLIIVEDMTYIAQQAQQLKLAALGRFSASIAHELRNPLGAIAHAAQLLGEEGGLNEEDSRLKQLIENNCERMNGVIKNVLQLSRREQSQPQLNEISTFLEQFKQNFAHNDKCNIIIKLSRKKMSIVFDRSQLEQILVILCENSIMHGQDKTGKANIVISAKSFVHKLIITVSDSGPGVPLEHRDSIFEPFFTTLRNGTGMGLFIAKDLCEINQARLNLMKVNKGCSFSITQKPMEELLL